MSPLRDPVWRGSPWVLLRHYPAYAVAVLLGCAALALSALSGRSFVDAAEVTLLQGQVDAVPDGAPAAQQGRVVASVFDGRRPSLEASIEQKMGALRDGTDPLAIRRPVRYRDSQAKPVPYAEVPGGARRATAVLFEATGAVASLVPAAGSPTPDGSGLWLPDTVAEQLGLGPGDQLAVGLDSGSSSLPAAPVAVTGVYRTDGGGAPRDPTGLWRDLADDLPPWPAHIPPTSAQIPLLVGDVATYDALTSAIGEQSLDTWYVYPAGDPVRLDDAEELADSAAQLQEELRDPSSTLFAAVGASGAEVSISSGLADIAARAREGWSATIQGVSAVRLVGMGLSWLVVMLAAVALLVRRRGERQLLVDQGRSPLGLAALSLVEAVVPAVLGLALGLWSCGPLVAHVVGVEGTPVRPQDTALVGLVVVLTLGLASLADALRRLRLTSGRTRTARTVPWRTVVLTLAVVGGASAYAGDGDFDATTALFPLAAVAAVGVVASGALTALLARVARGWQPRGLAARLTFSRLARDRSTATAFLAATVAFGAVGYGLLFQTSARDAADDKVTVAEGATSRFGVTDTTVRTLLPPAVQDRSTTVLTTVVTTDTDAAARMLLVDHDTFARTARWLPRLADGRSLDDVLASVRPGGGSWPIAVVGEVADTSDVAETGTLGPSDGAFSVDYRVAERLRLFPGLDDRPTLFVADASVVGDLPPAALADLDVELWSSDDAGTVRRAAEAVGYPPRLLGSAAQLRADPVLVARGWVTEYLQAFTLLALALGLLVLVGLHRRDREQRLLQDVTLADLGQPPRLATRAAGRELALVSLLGALTGGLAAYAVTRALVTPLDPLPVLPPALTVTGTHQLVVAGLVFVAAALLITLPTGRLGRTRSVNELLHDE